MLPIKVTESPEDVLAVATMFTHNEIKETILDAMLDNTKSATFTSKALSDKNIREAIKGSLESSGYEVDVALAIESTFNITWSFDLDG